jgi:hypothetical protein
MGRNQFVIDNVSDGFDLHQTEDGAFVRTFRTGIAIKRVPKQVMFAENSRAIVGGSDHGAVYVFDRKSGKKLAVLRHSERGLVQTITVRSTSSIVMPLKGFQVHENDGLNVIAASSSDSSGENSISIWTGCRPNIRSPRGENLLFSARDILQILTQLIVVMAAAAILYQNMHGVSPCNDLPESTYSAGPQGKIPHPCNWLPCPSLSIGNWPATTSSVETTIPASGLDLTTPSLEMTLTAPSLETTLAAPDLKTTLPAPSLEVTPGSQSNHIVREGKSVPTLETIGGSVSAVGHLADEGVLLEVEESQGGERTVLGRMSDVE